MAYVDLNPIRAGMADSPEKSDLTSAQDRIFAFNAQEHSKTETSSTWQQPKNSDTTSEPMKNRADWLTPVESIRVGQEQRGWLLTLEEYLTILDETGRCMKDGKRGVIPQGLAPILSRMKLRQENWLLATQRFGNRFYRISGRIERMAEAAKKVGQKWFQGMSFSKEVFLN